MTYQLFDIISIIRIKDLVSTYVKCREKDLMLLLNVLYNQEGKHTLDLNVTVFEINKFEFENWK